MSRIELRYLASREWMRDRILAGEPVESRHQVLAVETSSLAAELKERAEAVVEGVAYLHLEPGLRACIFDSGVNPELVIGKADDSLAPLDDPIVDELGVLPELPNPTDDVESVVSAWEGWRESYLEAGLKLIAELNESPPNVVRVAGGGKAGWRNLVVKLSGQVTVTVRLEEGPEAVRDARAIALWTKAARDQFAAESVAAAREATMISAREARSWQSDLEPAEVASRLLKQRRERYRAAKAHDAARRAQGPDFDTEMTRWSEAHGSDRLKTGIEDGYRMNSLYLSERIAKEVPGMYAMPVSAASTGWAIKASSPTEAALTLRRKIAAAIERNAPANRDGRPEVTIMVVKKPPHQIYFADPGIDGAGVGLPSRDGWPWTRGSFSAVVGADPHPFEAVVVSNWLGRFHLIGAVGSGEGGSARDGIWAKPDPEAYGDDGTVASVAADSISFERAQRKPPDPAGGEADIPF